MVSIFNRKELFVTFRQEEQARIRTALQNAGIDYSVKVVNRNSASPFAAGSRNRVGSFGNRLPDMNAYYIYVRKEDYEIASKLI